MANHASHAALPYPIAGARFTVLLPYLDADGDPTVPTTPDTEISKDNAAAADCAEEVSATSGMDGMSMLTLTGAEMDCSTIALNAKVASGPKATLGTIYPRVLAIIGSGTLSAGSAGGGTLGTLLPYDLTGCFIKTTGGTGGGGTGGTNNQVRKMVTYTPSSGAFTVARNWETTPSTDTTYDVLLPEGVTLGMLRTFDLGNVEWPASGVLWQLGILDCGVAQSATATTLRLRSAFSVTNNNIPKGSALIVWSTATAGKFERAIVRSYDNTTKDCTIDGWVGETPSGAPIRYVLLGSVGMTASDLASIRSALGMAAANLDTQLTTIDDFLDTEVPAIKAKTDNLPSDPADQSLIIAATDTILARLPAALSAAGNMKSDVKEISDTAIQGVGTVGNPWRPV